jgi:hypothetical protein
MGNIIEIASYPKCGNTWLRYLLANAFNLNVDTGIPDVHQQKKKTREIMAQVSLSNNTFFYKSHILDNQLILPDRIIYIYRHPLDVFFSSLNYFYITKNEKQFIGNILKSVEHIYYDNEIDYYFEDFLCRLGKNYYQDLLGDSSDYSIYVKRAFNNPKVIPLAYENLVDDPLNTFNKLLYILFPDDKITVTKELFDIVNAVTKNSKKPFYWKAKKETFLEFLSELQIKDFNNRHEDLLHKLGYITK